MPFLSPMKVKSESEVAQSCRTLGDPTDCSLPGSSVHGIFLARVLEWVAIAFSALFPKERIKDYFSAYLWEGSLARPHLSIPSDVLLSILLPHRLIENKVVVTHGKKEEGRDKKG